MKRIIILGIALFCFQWMNAQTECENMFSKAKNYYVNKDYANAKTQFQKVVRLCPSNADAAREYINLCDIWNNSKAKLVDQPLPNVPKEDSQRIKELENRINSLQADSTKRANTINTYAEKMQAKNNAIDSLERVIKQSVDLANQYKNEKEALFGSLRDMGKELNVCLEEKLSKDNKQKIQLYDGVSNDSIMEVFRENLKLVNDIKTPVLF